MGCLAGALASAKPKLSHLDSHSTFFQRVKLLLLHFFQYQGQVPSYLSQSIAAVMNNPVPAGPMEASEVPFRNQPFTNPEDGRCPECSLLCKNRNMLSSHKSREHKSANR